MITDDNGTLLTYWPISGLVAGHDSAPITIRVPTPQPHPLGVRPNEKIVVFVRRAGTSDPFVDLAQNPIGLSGLAGPYTRFDVYIHAVVGVGPFERIGMNIGAIEQTAAAWDA